MSPHVTMKRCRASLTKEPLPLYSDTLDIAVLWNAKAACTFAIKWLLYQEGLLEEAEAYAPWIHQYRQQVYCRRPKYSDKVKRIPELGPRAIKFVRDPFDRAVSSYLSFCQQAYRLTSSQHTPMLRDIGRHLSRPVGNGELFTFREFVSYLGSVDLDRANIHVRRQSHACERSNLLPDLSIIRIERSAIELPRLEDQLKLMPSSVSLLRRSQHHTTREATGAFVGDDKLGSVIDAPVPETRAFYDAELESAIKDLYAIDLEAYGYESQVHVT